LIDLALFHDRAFDTALAVNIVGSMLTPVFVRSVRPAFVMAGGLVLAAIGFGVLAQIHAPSGLATLVAGSVLLSVGLAPLTTVSTDMIVAIAPAERAGAFVLVILAHDRRRVALELDFQNVNLAPT